MATLRNVTTTGITLTYSTNSMGHIAILDAELVRPSEAPMSWIWWAVDVSVCYHTVRVLLCHDSSLELLSVDGQAA